MPARLLCFNIRPVAPATRRVSILTHRQLFANIVAIGHRQLQSHAADDVFVSWLPLYHDMGLIGAWLGSLTSACSWCRCRPLRSSSDPAVWLQTIDEHRGDAVGRTELRL